jgi:hypothetical protein
MPRYGVFGYGILETKFDYVFTFFTFSKTNHIYSTSSKKSNLEICKQNKSSILISKIQHLNTRKTQWEKTCGEGKKKHYSCGRRIL